MKVKRSFFWWSLNIFSWLNKHVVYVSECDFRYRMGVLSRNQKTPIANSGEIQIPLYPIASFKISIHIQRYLRFGTELYITYFWSMYATWFTVIWYKNDFFLNQVWLPDYDISKTIYMRSLFTSIYQNYVFLKVNVFSKRNQPQNDVAGKLIKN